ncbi:MAG: cytochrome c oxidase subunit II transmembrane domain-containing protein [Thermoplasmatota archaeon]
MRVAPILAVGALLLTTVGGAAASFGMPDPLTPRGQEIGKLFTMVAVAGSLVFLLVFAVLVVVLIRFREGSGKGKATHERERHSTGAEVAWLVGPLILVMWIGVMSYQGLMHLDTPQGVPEGEIGVTASQWAWTFDYSKMAGGDGVAAQVTTTNDNHGNYTYSDTFHVPEETFLRLNITSNDVIHAFQVLDGNHAAFSFNDANPFGDHKYTPIVVAFPGGTYNVQCNKFCGNPGHAGMLAQIVAEPRADFDHWLKHRHEAAGATIVQDLKVTATPTGFTVGGQPPANLTLVVGERLLVEASNPLDHPVTFTAGGESLTVPPKGDDFFHADFNATGPGALSSDTGGTMRISVIQATAVPVTLVEYSITPSNIPLTKGTQYLIQVHNAGTTIHNFYIGHYGGTVVAHSDNVPAGGTVSFLFQPTDSGSFEDWCNVPGHYQLGMHAQLTVN